MRLEAISGSLNIFSSIFFQYLWSVSRVPVPTVDGEEPKSLKIEFNIPVPTKLPPSQPSFFEQPALQEPISQFVNQYFTTYDKSRQVRTSSEEMKSPCCMSQSGNQYSMISPCCMSQSENQYSITLNRTHVRDPILFLGEQMWALPTFDAQICFPP